jgi:hypothetical protein
MAADEGNKAPPHFLNWVWSVASEVQNLDEITIVNRRRPKFAMLRSVASSVDPSRRGGLVLRQRQV